MIGLGTIVNVGTVLIGTTIGILLKNGLPKRFEKTVMQGLGLSTCFIGIGGTLSEVFDHTGWRNRHPAYHAALYSVWHSALSSVKR